MIRRHVLAALAAAVAAGDDDAARAHLATIDPILRGRARRALERALIEAALAASEFNAFHDPEGARHVQRLAALAVARVPVASPLDRAGVAAAYASLPAPRPSRAPIATLLAALALLAFVGGSYAYYQSLPDRPRRAYARPLPPPAAGAFRDGGVPLRDAALERLLVEEFTQLVIESDRDRRSSFDDPERKARTARLMEAAPVIARGPALATAWRAMLTALDRWVHEPTSSEQFEQVNRALRTNIRAVSDQLAALGIGYWLEGDVISSGDGIFAVIYCYRVEQVVFVTANGAPRRVLSLRRLDRLNLTKTLLGFQSAELGDPVLLLDQIDEHVTTKILPVLEDGAAFPFMDREYRATPEGARVAAIAGAAVRRELYAALGPDADKAKAVAAALGERNRLIASWRDELHRQGLRMASTDALFVDEGLLDALAGKVTNSERARVRELDDEIARLEGPRIAARCHDLVAATIRRHEAQHGVDDERPAMLRYPAALEALLGPAEDADGEPRRSVERARHELSAYTSQLLNDPVTPQFTLWNLAQFAFSEHSWGSRESYAAVIVVEGLARHLGIASPGPVIHDGLIDRARLAALVTPLAALPGDELRTAARALWTELFGEAVVAIVDR